MRAFDNGARRAQVLEEWGGHYDQLFLPPPGSPGPAIFHRRLFRIPNIRYLHRASYNLTMGEYTNRVLRERAPVTKSRVKTKRGDEAMRAGSSEHHCTRFRVRTQYTRVTKTAE